MITFLASGITAEVFSRAVKIAIGFLFFLYGARPGLQDALAGVKHWRSRITILAFALMLLPIFGLLMKPLDWVLPSGLYLGILHPTLTPSTIQSNMNFTSIAKDNVTGAIVNISASNLPGAVVTPVLVMLLVATGGGAHVDPSVFLDISLQLLLLFAIGQLARRWTLRFTAAKMTKSTDRPSTVMIVYVASSEGMVQDIWSKASAGNVVILVLLSIALVEFVLQLSGSTASKTGPGRRDHIAIQFCGSKESLAIGLPMAIVIFGVNASLYILPLMVLHQIRPMICVAYATCRGKETETEPERQPAQRGRGRITGIRS